MVASDVSIASPDSGASSVGADLKKTKSSRRTILGNTRGTRNGSASNGDADGSRSFGVENLSISSNGRTSTKAQQDDDAMDFINGGTMQEVASPAAGDGQDVANTSGNHFSSTDAVLKQAAAQSNGKPSRQGSVLKKYAFLADDDERQANGNGPRGASAPPGLGSGDGAKLPRRDSDNRSTASRSSARATLGNILSRKTSRRGSQGPELSNNDETSSNSKLGRRKSLMGGIGAIGGTDLSRKVSNRIPSLRKKTAASDYRDEVQTSMAEKPDGVSSIPVSSQEEVTGASARRNGSRRRPSASASQEGEEEEEKPSNRGIIGDNSVPSHPHRVRTARKKAPKEDEKEENESHGLLGGATAAIAGAGAAAGGVVAAIAGKATGQGDGEKDAGHDEEESEEDDDEFHDAENLDDIAEHDEEDEDEDEESEEEEKPQKGKSASAAKQSMGSRQSSGQGRHRQLSEGEGLALGAGAAGAAGAAAYGARRSDSPEAGEDEEAAGKNGRSKPSKTPSQLRGTSGAKRRSGSVPVGEDENTPTDKKARDETPFYVREKAARVRKLTYDDVSMSEQEMRADIEGARKALHLFLNSHMIEAEEIIAKYADRKLYYALGDAIIAVIKGFMTFEPEDLAKAISYCKDALHIASLLRKQSSSVASFGRFVRGTGHGPSAMAAMDPVQRHAELIFAESTLLKSVMGILYSGDFFGFVAEALSMRSAYGIYRSLSKYVEWADDKAGGRDSAIDEDFRSGVFLGNGLISMILGLLPGKVLKIMEVFGYSGDTEWALKTLSRAGEWSKDKPKPGMSIKQEGIRRQICDMSILLYHLVISTFIPVTGVDIDYADKILHYNLDRYPKGVFFLYFSGRLYSTQSLAGKAVKQFRAARDVQKEYVQLQHICVWDMSLCHMSLTQYEDALECFDTLYNDSNWSKCVYAYGRAANMYSLGELENSDSKIKEASKIFQEVPGKMQRIAGKSIPMEKYCARKAKKFIQQKRLLMPAIEFSYIYHCLTNAPEYSLCDNQLVEISDALHELNEVRDPSDYHSGADEYWDDYCLAHFLRGVTLRYIAFPEPHAKLQKSKHPIPKKEAAEQSEISLRNVIEASHRLALDHYLCYFAHYELGRLLSSKGDKSAAREQYDMIMSGKMLEANPGKGSKYSMKNMCTLRTNGALAVL